MQNLSPSRSVWPLRIAAVVAVLFGLLTIKEGGTVLFTEEGRRAAGNFVPFVLQFNFLAGFAYVAAGIGLWRQQRWAALLASIIAGSTLLVGAAFIVHILFGGAFEQRTAIAMTARSIIWVVIALVALRLLPRRTA